MNFNVNEVTDETLEGLRKFLVAACNYSYPPEEAEKCKRALEDITTLRILLLICVESIRIKDSGVIPDFLKERRKLDKVDIAHSLALMSFLRNDKEIFEEITNAYVTRMLESCKQLKGADAIKYLIRRTGEDVPIEDVISALNDFVINSNDTASIGAMEKNQYSQLSCFNISPRIDKKGAQQYLAELRELNKKPRPLSERDQKALNYILHCITPKGYIRYDHEGDKPAAAIRMSVNRLKAKVKRTMGEFAGERVIKSCLRGVGRTAKWKPNARMMFPRDMAADAKMGEFLDKCGLREHLKCKAS